ncbi:hypothetical protein SAMN05216226_102153 [Halovenus aranensis]|uniref:PadR family transcriptional regulator n=1 Tax=Halovenus aranensis TaxID=890420 RepID=A0A1G8SUJ5_9EURY|nr:hypothetical protein [Halovenus aranensis]SDJ32917.1 hypothetical protein SAMN05216226_102153 [Halovenus aranensis]
MAKEDRQQQVLQFLAEYDLALPPRAIYRNLRLHYNITFGYSSVDNYLDEFVEEGLCDRVDPEKLEERELVSLPSGRTHRAYYIITEKGRDKLSD